MRNTSDSDLYLKGHSQKVCCDLKNSRRRPSRDVCEVCLFRLLALARLNWLHWLSME